MPRFTPRQRHPQTGKLVCPGCHPDGKGSPGRPVGVHGSTQRVAKSVCPDCLGRGSLSVNGMDTRCSTCGGRGWVYDSGDWTVHDPFQGGGFREAAKTAVAVCPNCGSDRIDDAPPGSMRSDRSSAEGSWECLDCGTWGRNPQELHEASVAAANEVTCPRCRGRGTHMRGKSMGRCSVCDGKGTVPAWKAQRAAMRTVAHDSGDGERIFHCFAGETEYLTPEGRKTLADTVGTEQYVLTNPGNGGTWVQAHIHAFGEQRLYAVTVQRNKQTKVLHATDGHRWLKRGRRTEDTVVTTLDLQAGDRLSWLLPRSLIATSTPSPFGIAHGIVYGDGTRAAKGSVVNLWGDKDAQLLRYFSESRTTPIKTPMGVEGVRVLDLPAAFKGAPSLDESIPYLYGWLAGYFAADGNVTKQGQAVLDSADLGALELVERVCLRLGIATYGIRTRSRIWFGQAREVHRLQFVNSTLRPNFFLIDQHRERYDAAIERGNPERLGWTVVSVEETDRIEEVYCAVVPGTETFTLADYLHTGNCPFCGSGAVVGGSDGTTTCDFCKTSFTVQVQPEYSTMPQTINGVPQEIPGMPGDPTQRTSPELGQEGDQPPGGEEQKPPGHPPDGDAKPPGEDDDKPKNPVPPQFRKGSALYLNADGVPIPEDSFIRHLAVRFADDHDGILADLRAERSR